MTSLGIPNAGSSITPRLAFEDHQIDPFGGRKKTEGKDYWLIVSEAEIGSICGLVSKSVDFSKYNLIVLFGLSKPLDAPIGRS